MADTRSARFDRRQIDAIEDMVETGRADNESEAHRMLVDAGMAELGVGQYDPDSTWITWFTAELAKMLTLLAVGWIAATEQLLTFPFGLSFGVYLLSASVGVLGVHYALQAAEPAVSDRLKRAFSGGDEA